MTSQTEALAPLRQRFNAQHYALLKFYADCSELRYLTSLTSVPKLSSEPPNLFEQNSTALVVPPVQRRASPSTAPSGTQRSVSPEPEALNTSWTDEQQRQLILQQQHLALQQQQERQRQLFLQQQRLQQQREFEEQQRLQMERDRMMERAPMEMEALKMQIERDKMTISQYDQVPLLY